MQRITSIAIVALFAVTAMPAAFAQDAQPSAPEGGGNPAEAFIEQLDTDGDGKVSLEEALAPQASRFKENDTDGDGVITAAEASESFKAQVPPEMLEAMKERGMPDPGETFVKNLDKNGDGSVDQEEFQQPTIDAFQRMDADSDGFATQEEASAYFADLKEQMEEQMRRMQEQQQQQQEAQ
jgi:Ca2+-binding EF-hand superfamily protein